MRPFHSARDVPRPQSVLSYAPGLFLVAFGTLVAIVGHRIVPSVSTLVAAVVFGAIVGNGGLATHRTIPGLQWAAHRLLRVGIVLLGLRLSVVQVLQLGGPLLAVVVATVFATFFGTQWIGRRLGLSADVSLLVGTGYAICGVSAIAAMEGSTNAKEEEVAVAIGLVTLAGSVAIFALPALGGALELSDRAFGAWAGASVHDVAQVIATASSGGEAALTMAVVVKLTRVAMLAPLIAGVNLYRRREKATKSNPDGPSPLPLFVIGFLAMVTLSSFNVLPTDWISTARSLEGILLTAALVGLGSGISFDRLRGLGPRVIMLGSLAWLLVGAVSLAGVYLTT